MHLQNNGATPTKFQTNKKASGAFQCSGPTLYVQETCASETGQASLGPNQPARPLVTGSFRIGRLRIPLQFFQ